jgi:hypothetical protein
LPFAITEAEGLANDLVLATSVAYKVATTIDHLLAKTKSLLPPPPQDPSAWLASSRTTQGGRLSLRGCSLLVNCHGVSHDGELVLELLDDFSVISGREQGSNK